MNQDPQSLGNVETPALVIDRQGFDRNVSTMSALHPGPSLRPHVKAFKSTTLAAKLADAGHRSFCTATIREIEGMVAAGLSDDLLLANETNDYRRLGALVEQGAGVTVAVDSEATVVAAANGGVRHVLVDVEVGMPRCGCSVDEAGALAELARAKGLEVRGVMGYEGHLMMVPDPAERRAKVERSMEKLLAAHRDVGGDIISAGGTGTYAVNEWATEIQAGSYCLMDHHYDSLELPFEIAMYVMATVISVSSKGWFVLDAGLKAMAMDHGNPTCPSGEVMFCSDEHTTVRWKDKQGSGQGLQERDRHGNAEHRPETAGPASGNKPKVGDRMILVPGHVDPTVAKHRQFWVADNDRSISELETEALRSVPVADRWPIDLRHW